MLIENDVLQYTALNTLLTQQQIGLTAAEIHGLISGIICGGNQDSSWQPLLHDLTNESMTFSSPLSQMVNELHDATKIALEDDNFLFQPLLPADDSEVFERIDALAGWVNHFLLGLGVIQPKLDKVTGETGEVIDDLRSIGQLGYDLDEDKEELEQSLEEVLEYVRVAAMICYNEFNSTAMSLIREVRLPTLH